MAKSEAEEPKAAPAASGDAKGTGVPPLIRHRETALGGSAGSPRQYGWFEAAPSPDGEDRVAFFETHPDHPGGDAFVAPGPARQVALTPAVRSAEREGRIRAVPGPPKG